MALRTMYAAPNSAFRQSHAYSATHSARSLFSNSLTAASLAGALLMASPAIHAQEPNPTSQNAPSESKPNPITEQNGIYIYKVKVVQRNLNIQPTLTIRPGFPVRVIVNRDLVLEPYKG